MAFVRDVWLAVMVQVAWDLLGNNQSSPKIHENIFQYFLFFTFNSPLGGALLLIGNNGAGRSWRWTFPTSPILIAPLGENCKSQKQRLNTNRVQGSDSGGQKKTNDIRIIVQGIGFTPFSPQCMRVHVHACTHMHTNHHHCSTEISGPATTSKQKEWFNHREKH